MIETFSQASQGGLAPPYVMREVVQYHLNLNHIVIFHPPQHGLDEPDVKSVRALLCDRIAHEDIQGIPGVYDAWL